MLCAASLRAPVSVLSVCRVSSRLAKATLTLIPLFGIHEVVFIFATDEQTTGILRYIKVFFTLFLNSFQVGLPEESHKEKNASFAHLSIAMTIILGD